MLAFITKVLSITALIVVQITSSRRIPPERLYENFYEGNPQCELGQDIRTCFTNQTMRTDYICRYRLQAYGCECCGEIYNYIEFGDVCTRYCKEEDEAVCDSRTKDGCCSNILALPLNYGSLSETITCNGVVRVPAEEDEEEDKLEQQLYQQEQKLGLDDQQMEQEQQLDQQEQQFGLQEQSQEEQRQQEQSQQEQSQQEQSQQEHSQQEQSHQEQQPDQQEQNQSEEQSDNEHEQRQSEGLDYEGDQELILQEKENEQEQELRQKQQSIDYLQRQIAYSDQLLQEQQQTQQTENNGGLTHWQ